MILLKHKRKVVAAIEDKKLERLIMDAKEAHEKKRDMESLLKNAKELLLQKAKNLGLGIGTWNFEVEGKTVKVKNYTVIEITDPRGLAQLLGEKFKDYVKVEVNYIPRKDALQELLADGDGELAQEVRNKLSISIKREVQWS